MRTFAQTPTTTQQIPCAKPSVPGLLRRPDVNSAQQISKPGREHVCGKGLVRDDETKIAAGHRTIALPRFAIDVLALRRELPYLGEHPTIMHLARPE
jgi:hypothetical protein